MKKQMLFKLVMHDVEAPLYTKHPHGRDIYFLGVLSFLCIFRFSYSVGVLQLGA